MDNVLVWNGVTVKPGDLFIRQGDVGVVWEGYADVLIPTMEILERVPLDKVTVARGESLGHEHNLRVDAPPLAEADDNKIFWLKQLTVENDPGYIEKFNRALLPPTAKLVMQTGRHQVLLVHEDPRKLASDKHNHTAAPLPPNSVLSIIRQRERDFDQRVYLSPD